MTPLIEKIRNDPRTKKVLPNDVPYFDLGVLSSTLEVVPGDPHLPFPKIIAVWRYKNKTFVGYFQEDDFIGGFSLLLDEENTTSFIISDMAAVKFLENGDTLFFDVHKNNITGEEHKWACFYGALMVFHVVLAQSSQTAYIPTPKANSLINKKRIAKGKPPLQFEWRTVVIEPKRAQSVSKGGTHAPPRLHTRRGHYRKYKSGKRVWIRDCMVGDPTKGFIKHDYKVVTHHDPSD